MATLILRCRDCGSKYRLRDHVPGEILPDCPKCGAADENKLDLTKPVRIAQGGSNQAKAIDLAWDMAQKDYGLTDMRSGVDPGETVAPKLTKQQQEMDRVWKQAGTFQAPQRFPGLAAGQGWLDAARAAHSSTGNQDVAAVQNVFRGLKQSKLAIPTMSRDDPKKPAVLQTRLK